MGVLAPFSETSVHCPPDLSSRRVILLFGSEDWILSSIAVVLKWPKHFSNTAAMTTLDFKSITSRLVLKKLCFLRRQLVEEAVGVTVMRSMMDDPDSLCLVKECRELEGGFGTHFTDVILVNADVV